MTPYAHSIAQVGVSGRQTFAACPLLLFFCATHEWHGQRGAGRSCCPGNCLDLLHIAGAPATEGTGNSSTRLKNGCRALLKLSMAADMMAGCRRNPRRIVQGATKVVPLLLKRLLSGISHYLIADLLHQLTSIANIKTILRKKVSNKTLSLRFGYCYISTKNSLQIIKTLNFISGSCII